MTQMKLNHNASVVIQLSICYTIAITMFGDSLFIYYGYHGNDKAPSLTLHPKGENSFKSFSPRDKTFSLTFDTAQRFCTGWHDLATSESFPCPDNAQLPKQFDHCRHCQNKTGFNPAFYHAASVSPQQQARNAQPHFLYIAHFAPGVIKVGISWAERGISRLLDQGARSSLIIKTYPSATIARQYEAKIASLPDIAETLQVKAKHKFLGRIYDSQAAANELLKTRHRLTKTFGMTPDDNNPIYLDSYYTGVPLQNPIILHDEHKISGNCIGMLGSTILMEQDGQQFGLNLGDLTGYRMYMTSETEANKYQPQQVSLF